MKRLPKGWLRAPIMKATPALSLGRMGHWVLLGWWLLTPSWAAAESYMWLKVAEQPVLAEVMVGPQERATGMMFRPHFPDDRLMLFMYQHDGRHQIWMKNCRFALDVAWLDAAGTVVSTATNLPPCKKAPCPIYGPSADTRHFIEGTVGWLSRYGVGKGSHIELGALLEGSQPPAP